MKLCQSVLLLFFSLCSQSLFAYKADPSFITKAPFSSKTQGSFLLTELGVASLGSPQIILSNDIGADGDASNHLLDPPDLNATSRSKFYIRLGLYKYIDAFALNNNPGLQIQILGENSPLVLGPYSLSIYYFKIKDSENFSTSGGGIFSPKTRSWGADFKGDGWGSLVGYSYSKNWDFSLRLSMAKGQLTGSLQKTDSGTTYAFDDFSHNYNESVLGLGAHYLWGENKNWILNITADQNFSKLNSSVSQNFTTFSISLGYIYRYLSEKLNSNQAPSNKE